MIPLSSMLLIFYSVVSHSLIFEGNQPVMIMNIPANSLFGVFVGVFRELARIVLYV